MKIPIPNDWDGKSWDCIQIRWPSSPLWRAILTGFLSLPAFGYFWNEKTGTITDVQQIGREIFDENFPYVSCGAGVIEPTPEPTEARLRAIGECLAMSCSIPYGSLRWGSNGQLQYIYCGTWYDVDGQPSNDGPIGPDYTPPEIDGGGYSACGKATAVLEMFRQLLNSIFDEVGNNSLSWWGHIKADNPGVHMDAKWIMTAGFGAVNQVSADNAAGEEYDPDAFDESTWQSVLCALSRDFSDAMPELMNGNDIRTKVQNYFASEWGTDLLTNAVFVDAARGVNRSSWEDAAASGANFDQGNCACPTADSEPLEPVAGGWYLGGMKSIQFAYDDDKESSYTRVCGVETHDIYGMFHWGTIVSQIGGLNRYGKDGDGLGCAHDVQMTAHNAGPAYQPGDMNCQMEDTPGQNLYNAMGTALPRYYDLLGQYSKVIPSPVCLGGQTNQVMFFGEADADDSGILRIDYRFVHNNLSPSHD